MINSLTSLYGEESNEKEKMGSYYFGHFRMRFLLIK